MSAVEGAAIDIYLLIEAKRSPAIKMPSSLVEALKTVDGTTEVQRVLQMVALSALYRDPEGVPEAVWREFDAVESELAERNLGLALVAARRIGVGSGSPLIDRLQDALGGLVTAITRFDPFRGLTFATYASHWTRQAVARSVANESRMIRLPVHFYELVGKLADASDDMNSQGNAIGDWAPLDVKKMAMRPVLLSSYQDLELADPDEDVEARASRPILREQVEDVLASLTSRERRVLQLRFGLEDGRSRTLEEVGREFGVTRERIRQIEAKALRKLRHPSRSRKLRDWLD
ncbi:MAG: sigma-70 family RNA polymerase sigma factor [Dehalococcoidia bacterium]